ncbi:SMI1/KNR4 family protein [Streptomyces sp. NPDC051561]|uniref:SMI1/KNR4 family protein n=1 Tax=Streptomyces sp. NPDC051561 TaxID=3365658 RepID=UPI0037B37A62
MPWEPRAADSAAAFANLFALTGADPVPVDWDTVESWLGLRLPADYKAIASAFGPLDLGRHLWLHIPCAQEGRFDYAGWLKQEQGHAPDGWLPWGATRTSDVLYWDTTVSDDPDAWPVVGHDQDVANRGGDPWQRTTTPLLPFLAGLVRQGMPATASRTAFLTDLVPGPWTPPPPRPKPTPQQRAALTEGSGLAALTALVPAPPKPELGEQTWEWLYERLGTRLPTAYTELMRQYGGGTWAGWLNLGTPLSADRLGLAEHARWGCDVYRSLRDGHPEYYPLAVWPEPGGILPFGDTIDGDALCWLTVGDSPDDWPLIVHPRHSDQGPPLPLPLADTLLEWFRGRFAHEGFPSLGKVKDPFDHAQFESFADDEAEEAVTGVEAGT